MKASLVLPALGLLALSLMAEPPSLESLRGSWWDEDGSSMLLFEDGDAGSVLHGPSQKTMKGCFQVAGNGKIVFAPAEGLATAWEAGMDGEFLVLKDSDGTTRRFRRETRSAREGRCIKAWLDYTEAKRFAEVPNPPPGEADRLWKRCDELKVAFSTLLGSLAGDGVPAQEKLLEELLDRSAPEAAQSFRDSVRQAGCLKELKRIWTACQLFKTKHKSWPKDLAALEGAKLGPDSTPFRCPVGSPDTAYVYLFPSKGDSTPPDAVLAYDRAPHPNARRGVLTFGGTVLRLGQEDFERALKDGVDRACPQVWITSARVVEEGGKRVLVVEGKVAGLKPSGKEPNPGGRGKVSVEISGRRKAPLESAPVPLQGAAGSQVPFSLRVDLSSEEARDITVWAVVHDDVREEDYRTKVEFTK